MNVQDYVKDGLLKIYVKPNASEMEIEGYNEQRGLIVRVSEPADKNKANKEIVRYFSKLLGKRVLIKSGLTSKRKTLIIEP